MALKPLDDPEDLVRQRLALRRAFKKDCDEESNAESCHKYAEFVQAVDKDYKEAAVAYEQNCKERRYGPSCLGLGLLAYVGTPGVTKDKDLGTQLFVDGCNLGCHEACNNAGMALRPSDPERAAPLFEKACDHKVAQGCFNLGTMFLTGMGKFLENKEKALEFSTRACDLGHPYGCVNASRMLMLGDGVEKDETRAKEFRKRGEELYANRA